MRNVITKDLVERALQTFWQAALVALLVGVANSNEFTTALVSGDWEALRSIAIMLAGGALGAGLSAVKTLVVGLKK